MRPAWRHAWIPAAIVALAAVAYGGSLRNPLVFDDLESIRDNVLLRDLGNYLPFARGYAQHPTRWIAYLTFALNYAAGGLDASGYRAVNVAVHVANAALVYLLVAGLFATPVGRRSSGAASARTTGFVAAALFVAHPLQTMAVTYVVQRLTSLATLFYLATVVQYVRWRVRSTELSPGASAARYAGVVLTSALAMKTKEIAFTLPVAILLLEWLFFGRPRRRELLALAPIFATALLVPAALLGWHGALGDALRDASQATHVQTQLSRVDYLRTECVVVAKYLRLLVLPLGQNVDPDQPVYSSFAAPPVLLGGAVLAALAATAIVLAWRSRPAARPAPLDPAARVVAFGIAWFFLTSSVESSVIPIVDVMFEHRAYLPSVGALVAAATALTWLVRAGSSRRRARACLAGGAALALALAVAARVRNRVWTDEVTLWGDAVEKSPAKARAHVNLGVALAQAGQTRRGIAECEEGIRLDPDDLRGYTNLGAILMDGGDLRGAVQVLRRAVDLDPDDPGASYDLGKALLGGGGDLEEAVRLFERALQRRPAYPEALANLGAALNRLRRFDVTIARLGGARAEIDQNAEARFNLGVAYAMTGDAMRARAEANALLPMSRPLADRLEAFLREVGAGRR